MKMVITTTRLREVLVPALCELRLAEKKKDWEKVKAVWIKLEEWLDTIVCLEKGKLTVCKEDGYDWLP